MSAQSGQKQAIDFINISIIQQSQQQVDVSFDLDGQSNAPHTISIFTNGTCHMVQTAKKGDHIAMSLPVSAIPLGPLVNNYYEVEFELTSARNGRDTKQMKCIVPIYP